jgi:hypothetical protein
VAEWIKEEYGDSRKHLDLFRAETKSINSDSDEATWAFIPAMDLLLTVGDGMLTITAEGAGTDSTNTQGRCAFSVAMRRARRKDKKRGLQRESEQKAKKAKLNRAPTRVVLLTNMVGPGEVDEDLEQETAEEVGKYGKLKKCVIKESSGAPDNEAVRIFLEFVKVESASRAYSDLNGRYFGGRCVKARFFDEERYGKGDLDRFGPNATRTLFLTNLCSRADVDEDFEYETTQEASKFGKVLRCTATVLQDVPDPKAVQVFIEYDSLPAAAKALAELSGRVYDSHDLVVDYVEDGTTSCKVPLEDETALRARNSDQPPDNGSTKENFPPSQSPIAVDSAPGKTQIAIDLLLGAPSEKAVGGIAAQPVGEADDESDVSSIEHMRDSETGLWAL